MSMILCTLDTVLMYIHAYYIGVSVWVLVGEKTECVGSEIYKGKQPSIADCANQCEGTASMFAFGTNDYETIRCNDDGCRCLCETSAAIDGSCDRVNHDGYRLYKYTGKGNIFVYYN